jgi:archaellum biogenesis ATPase FlaH
MSNSHNSDIKIRAFLPFKNPVNKICIFFGSGCYVKRIISTIKRLTKAKHNLIVIQLVEHEFNNNVILHTKQICDSLGYPGL